MVPWLVVTLALAGGPWAGQEAPAPADPCASSPPASDPVAPPKGSERARLAPLVRQEWTSLVCEALARQELPRERPEGESPAAFEARVRTEYDRLLGELERRPVVQRYFDLLPDDRERYLRGGAPHPVGEEIGRHRSRLARSVEAAATNPLAVSLIERSGVTDLVSLATQGTNLLAADETAVTLNLGAAAALHALRRPGAGTSARRYRDAGVLNRLAGSVTFGSKIPEKALTGLSGLPDADTLFDAVGWDVKARLVGDRDPRATRWDDLLLGRMGGLAGLSVITDGAPVITDLGHRGQVQEAMTDRIGASSRDAARRIGGSLQISAKFSGQHLTQARGKNRYAAVLMVDKGIGSLDATLNASYSAVQDLQAGAAGTFTLKKWTVAAGLVGTFMRDAVVTGRGAELSLSADGSFPVDRASLPMDVRRTYRVNVALKLPVSKSLDLPFSLTWSDDPNHLAKEKYVTGRFGVTYDFGALEKLAKELVGGASR